MNLLARHQDPQVTFVSKVEMKGLAKQAGILVGDEIVSIGGKPAESYEGTVALVKGTPRPMEIQLQRKTLPKDQFLARIEEEATRLKNGGPFDPRTLYTIGWVYANIAQQSKGGFSGTQARIEQTQHTIKNQYQVLSGGIFLAKKMHQSSGKGEDGKGGPSDDQMLETMPVMLKTVMEVQNLDIEKTLRHVCKRVLDDRSVPDSVRMARIEALDMVGKSFLKHGTEKIGEGEEFMKMVQESIQPGSSGAATDSEL